MEQEEPKQETLKEASEFNFEKQVSNPYSTGTAVYTAYEKGFELGANWQAERMYSEEDMIKFAEFVATYTDKNKNVYGQMLHAKSKYDDAERTIDLFKIWYKQHKNK